MFKHVSVPFEEKEEEQFDIVINDEEIQNPMSVNMKAASPVPINVKTASPVAIKENIVSPSPNKEKRVSCAPMEDKQISPIKPELRSSKRIRKPVVFKDFVTK